MEENFKFFETYRENEKSCGNKINGEWKKTMMQDFPRRQDWSFSLGAEIF